MIVYTSGTTGKPKRRDADHGNLIHNVESCRKILEAVQSCDRFVVLLPMFHSFMLTVGILLPLLVGGSIGAHQVGAVAQKHFSRSHGPQSHHFPGHPQVFRALANAPMPDEVFASPVHQRRGAPPAGILREFNRNVPIPLLEGYGLSEASPVVSINPIPGPWKPGSIGLPIPGVEMSVQDDSGEQLAPGRTGEICVRGGNVMQGYWNRPEATAEALRGGWLLTGDIGYRDEDGYYFITDRKKDMLLVNGINVYPREIEEVIYQFPGVKEAAVVGVPDARRGELPVAFVSPNDDILLDARALLLFIKEKLADYKVPRRVIFLPASRATRPAKS